VNCFPQDHSNEHSYGKISTGNFQTDRIVQSTTYHTVFGKLHCVLETLSQSKANLINKFF